MLGFGAGKIDLKLGKTVFSPGEMIQGNVILKVNKPTKANGVKVIINAVRRSTRYTSGRRTSYTETPYNFEQELDVEREYQAEERTYKFQLQVPEGIGKKPDLGNEALGQLVNVASMLTGSSSNIRRNLTAKLDIPMGFDVSKTVQISVQEKQ